MEWIAQRMMFNSKINYKYFKIFFYFQSSTLSRFHLGSSTSEHGFFFKANYTYILNQMEWIAQRMMFNSKINCKCFKIFFYFQSSSLSRFHLGSSGVTTYRNGPKRAGTDRNRPERTYENTETDFYGYRNGPERTSGYRNGQEQTSAQTETNFNGNQKR